ncbi:MAG: serine protease AprX [Planctomycetota bacterium]|jgi:serine protease AprX
MFFPIAFALLAAGSSPQSKLNEVTGKLVVDPSPGLTSIFLPNGTLLHESARTIEQTQLLELNGGAIRIASWNERQGSAVAVPHYRLSLDGEIWSRVRETRFELELQRGSFDPLIEAAPITEESIFSDEGNVYIVQYVTQPLEYFSDQVEQLGGEVLRYMPRHAQIVSMSAETRASVSELPFVRWVGTYHPEYRLASELLEGLQSDDLPAQAPYMIQVFERGLQQKQRVAERIKALGGQVLELFEEGMFLQAELSPSALQQITSMDEILWVDPRGEPQTYMDKVRQDGGANFLENQTGYTGQGVRGEILDSGFLISHMGFQSNPPVMHNGNSTDTSHGTSVAGCTFGDGTGNALGRAALPDAQPIFSSFYNLNNRYAHTAQLLSAPYFAVFQSNSWGFGTGLAYNNWSTEIDDILFDFDITILHAQANTGANSSDFFAWGKNVVSVGGIRHQNTQSLADDSWSNAGSRGPAADGRIKPDLSYWFDSILTTSNSGGYTTGFGGTSAATPETAGFFGLFYQMWHEGVFGNNPTGATVFDSRPKATLAKAFMINGADQYDFSGGSHDLRRVNQGWGRPDVQSIYRERDNTFFINETEVLTNTQSVSFDLDVAAGQAEFRATLVYLDPAGTTSAAQHRINDLSLRVTTPSGLTYWGNRQMKGNMFTQVGGSSNTIDTVENVWLEDPEVGTWTVEVIADEINQDSHTETGALDADFALVVTGIETSTCPAPTNYCTGAMNSTGGSASMTSTGTSSVAANDFVMEATGMPGNQTSLFYYGAGQASVPFGNGTRCVSSPFYRLGVVSIDVFGQASWALDVTSPPVPGGQITSGTSWNFQAWYRDPAGGGAAFNLSDGLNVTFCN